MAKVEVDLLISELIESVRVCVTAETNAVFCRTLDVTLDLKDPQYPESHLGTLELSVTLSPKENLREAVRDSSSLLLAPSDLRREQLSSAPNTPPRGRDGSEPRGPAHPP